MPLSRATSPLLLKAVVTWDCLLAFLVLLIFQRS